LIKSVQSAGALNEKTKELILFSLVVGSRCQPCLEAHLRRARALGITQAELDEAAWCAIALGGAPVKMFTRKAWSGFNPASQPIQALNNIMYLPAVPTFASKQQGTM